MLITVSHDVKASGPCGSCVAERNVDERE